MRSVRGTPEKRGFSLTRCVLISVTDHSHAGRDCVCVSSDGPMEYLLSQLLQSPSEVFLSPRPLRAGHQSPPGLAGPPSFVGASFLTVPV